MIEFKKDELLMPTSDNWHGSFTHSLWTKKYVKVGILKYQDGSNIYKVFATGNDDYCLEYETKNPQYAMKLYQHILDLNDVKQKYLIQTLGFTIK